MNRTATNLPTPKVIGATVAALVVPILSALLGLDADLLTGAVTAVVTLAVAYVLPPGDTVHTAGEAEDA